jgi:glycosyltransferase involved in cell wall biosynthesis
MTEAGIISGAKPKMAMWFRYGPTENAKLFVALPDILSALAETMEVHYYGFRGAGDGDLSWAPHVHFHIIPLRINRASNSSKLFFSILWFLCLPLIAIHCRMTGIRVIYVDDAVPFLGFWPRLICGPKVALTVGDLLIETYGSFLGGLRPVVGLFQNWEARTWRSMGVIFVRSKSAVSILHEKYGVPVQKMVPVYDACDFGMFKPGDQLEARQKIGLVPASAFLICYHGVLHPNKGLAAVLVAMAPLLKARPDVHFVIIGNGLEYERLTRITGDRELASQVHFTGYMEPARVATFIHASDVGLVCRAGGTTDNLVVTSVLGRYMASRVAVLAARVSGIAEVVADGVNGALYDPRSPEEFLEKLTLLVESRETRKRLAEAGYCTAQQVFDKKNTAGKTVTAVLEMVRKPTATGL